MKKLIIAAAIVCAAVVSQAASFKWAASNVYGPGSQSETKWTGTATLFCSLAGENDYKIVSTTTMSAGAIIANSNVVTIDWATNPNKYDFYYTMEAKGIDGKDWVFTSGSKNGVMAQQSSSPQLGFLATGSWQAVPEPTSGLLLLLGVAGLALKRKHA